MDRTDAGAGHQSLGGAVRSRTAILRCPSALQLLVLASLEVSNAELIEQGLSRLKRILKLNQKAQERMFLLLDTASGKELVRQLGTSAKALD